MERRPAGTRPWALTHRSSEDQRLPVKTAEDFCTLAAHGPFLVSAFFSVSALHSAPHSEDLSVEVLCSGPAATGSN